MLYPMLMEPYYRHGKETPWGGRALAERFGRSLPDDLTGESLEISALAHTPSKVVNGRFAGRFFSDICAEYGKAVSGTKGEFPLLVKIIDARGLLSVQVHPGDDYALPRHNKLGKTEAWMVLSAEKGAKLFAGIEQGAPDFSLLAKDEKLMQGSLHAMAVEPGDVIYIPHGLVHALGSGIMVYEIQQSSDVTYRISDWGRLGTDGKPRQLHLEDAAHVVRQELTARKEKGVSFPCSGGVQTRFVAAENFELWEYAVEGDMLLPAGRMRLITSLDNASLLWADEKIDLIPGASAIIPCDCPDVILSGKDARVIVSMLPER